MSAIQSDKAIEKAYESATPDAEDEKLVTTGWNATRVASCPSCGAALAKGVKFCPECGEKINQEKFCTECGAKMTPSAKFCGECGAKAQ